MKKLLITLMLISPFSFADWGDVYSCQMTSYSGVSLEGKRINYILEKFQFKLDEAKNAMVFGSSGVFTGAVIKLSDGNVWPTQESWYGNTTYSMLYFDKGKFLYVRTGSTGNKSISADCDKLE